MARRKDLVVALILTSASACATMHPPVNSGGPTRSPEGVELTLAGEHCNQTREPGWHGLDLTELNLEVQVKNSTDAPVTVHRQDMRLLAAGGAALKTVTWGAGDPLYVSRGETKSFDIRFMSRGELACGAPLKLDTRGAVTSDDHVIGTEKISFTPSPRI